ncbi:GNAT family N-acetyltransferase [Nocardioides plantarum]|uniref:GNAT family N-acetyltransferase n=1 Tax=Nocardioides plantarum TaxID=29299 RepID=A0ABV5K614_9ACTN|nr:GNAT family N-acetyltransferase [Nocardioides plantarum]
MFVAGVLLSEPVAALLRRAMSDHSAQQELGAYEARADRDLYGWSVDHELVSVAGISNDRPDAELLHLATSLEHERHGHAGALLHAAFTELALRQLVAETDGDAVDFYRITGFEIASVASAWPGSRYRCTLRR